jgi:hypothetical protein
MLKASPSAPFFSFIFCGFDYKTILLFVDARMDRGLGTATDQNQKEFI